MRSSLRLFANAAKYLEPNTPTGLTGLTTHPLPRPALVWTYLQTLQKLQQMPSSSVYRQSVENLTKHRLAIVQSNLPEGYEAYKERVTKQLDATPTAWETLKREDGTWDLERIAIEEIPNPEPANIDLADDNAEERILVQQIRERENLPTLADLEQEPPLSADQIEAIENKIGAGLIEEVVTVAENELELVGDMIKDQPWQPLEEQAPPGQWSYFERGDRV